MDDPGWRDAWRGVLYIIVWPLGRRAQDRLPALLYLRRTFIGFLASLALILTVTFAVVGEPRPGKDSEVPDVVFAIGLLFFAALGLFGAIAIPRSRWKTVTPGTDATEIAGFYRTAFFLRMAFASSTWLVGYPVAFITYEPLFLVLSAAAAMPTLFITSPTVASVRRTDEIAQTHGVTSSLLPALLTRPTS